MSVLIVTGTDTGVGKTIATAALASAARQAGLEVTVCKPVQTGTDDGDDDLAEVQRLTAASGPVRLAGLARYPQPLAPVAAAQHARMALPARAELAEFVIAGDSPERLTLVEGAGGLLVELSDGITLRDLATELRAPALVVARAELGTLNHTALTLEALGTRGLACAGLVIGSWPAKPDTVQAGNRDALGRLASLRAALPAGSGALDATGFAAMSAAAFDPDWVRTLAG